MGSIDTMKLMGDAFVSLAERFPLEKISVSTSLPHRAKTGKLFIITSTTRAISFAGFSATTLQAYSRSALREHPLSTRRATSMPCRIYRTTRLKNRHPLSRRIGILLALFADTFQNRRAYYAKALRSNDP